MEVHNELIKEVLANLEVLVDTGYSIVNIEGGPIFDGWRTNMFENLKEIQGLQVGLSYTRGGLSLAPLPERTTDRLAFRYDLNLVTDVAMKTKISYHFDDLHCLSLHGNQEKYPRKIGFGYTLFDTISAIEKYGREKEFANTLFLDYDPMCRKFIPSEIRTKIKGGESHD